MKEITQVLNFNEFERLYESYNFINEAEDVLFTPDDLTVDPEELVADLAPQGATGSEKTKPVEEAETLDPQRIQPAKNYKPNQFSTIKRGEKSDRVKQLQKDLKLSPQDGSFGEATEMAVKEFQKNNKLSVDGKVGVQTLRKMLELNGDKNPESTIATKYKATLVKTADQAKAASIDPALLELFDVTLISNGTEQFVIMIPKKDTAAKAKILQESKFQIPQWLKGILAMISTGANPGSFIFNSTTVVTATLAAAKAIISAAASAAKFVVGGTVYVIGAVVQGLQTVANWAAKQGKSAYQKVSNTFNELFTRFCNGFASVAKSSMQGLTAFMTGLQTAGFVLTGIALKSFKAVSAKLDPVIKAVVNGAKDAAAFIKAGLENITKQGNEAIAKFKKDVQAGWTAVTNTTQKAWNGAKVAVKSTGESVAKAAQQAYTDTADWLSSCYEDGKKFWESLSDSYGDPIFESSLYDLDFSIV